jgi:3-oxoacyl-[acyl-carrier protein] reductase
MLDLSAQVVLITGANRGIGEATARAFASVGAQVGVHYHRDEARAQRVVRDINTRGVRAVALAADLRVWDEGESLLAACEAALGPPDVVVLNHGIWTEASIDTMTEAQYDEMLATNLKGVFSVAGAAARSMKPRRRGSIVLVSSTAGQRGEAHHSHYAATKGAVISLTKSLAPELAPWGIRVNCVAPGWVRTDMTEPTLADSASNARVLGTIPLGRVATPDEIAQPIVFVASLMAAFVTGEILNVNGGAVLVG